MPINAREVAALREKMAATYLSAKLGLQGLNAGRSRRQFIIAQQKRGAILHEELEKLVENKAITPVAEIYERLPDAPTRSTILAVLLDDLGQSEDAEILCDYLQDAWEIIDTLIDHFGVEQARNMILAPSSSIVGEIPLS